MKAGQAKESEKKPRRRIKKVMGHGGHHGGAWKVAYADFVTAMMSLFLVLWLVSQADTKLKEELANYFRSPGAFNTMKGGILSRAQKEIDKDSRPGDDERVLLAVATALREKFRSSSQFDSVKDRVRVDVTTEGLQIQIIDKADRVSFSSGSAELVDSTRQILAEVARSICELPNPIHIGGHTDRYVFPAGSSYTNWELSADRANAARRFLESSCVKPNQIRRVIGFADTQLLLPSEPYAAANRRISITVARMAKEPAKEAPPIQKDIKLGFEKVDIDKSGSRSNDIQPSPDGEKDEKSGSKNKAGKGGDSGTKDSQEKRLLKSKLLSEGSVKVGEADKLPEGVKRTREK
jgi:chemotaxis protein MotB